MKQRMYQEKITQIQDELSIKKLESVLTESQLNSLDESIVRESDDNDDEVKEKDGNLIIERIQKIMDYNKSIIQNNLNEIKRLNQENINVNIILKNKEIDYIASKAELESKFKDEISRMV